MKPTSGQLHDGLLDQYLEARALELLPALMLF